MLKHFKNHAINQNNHAHMECGLFFHYIRYFLGSTHLKLNEDSKQPTHACLSTHPVETPPLHAHTQFKAVKPHQIGYIACT